MERPILRPVLRHFFKKRNAENAEILFRACCHRNFAREIAGAFATVASRLAPRRARRSAR